MDNKLQLLKYCELCEANATSLCFECLEYFCDSCFKIIHEKKLKSQHKKEKIDFYVPLELKCPDHPKNGNNLFCLEEKGKIIKIIYQFYKNI